MAPDPKSKKRKAAPAPTSTAKKVKKSATASTKAGKKGSTLSTPANEGDPEPVAPSVGGVTRKRAADFFSESASESGDGGWDQLNILQTASSKRPKATLANNASALKPEIEKPKVRSGTKKVKTAAAKERQTEHVADRSEAKKRALQPELKDPSIAKEPRKPKKPKISEAATKKTEKTIIDETEEPTAAPVAPKSQVSKRAKTKGISSKQGNSQEKGVTDALSESEVEESGEEDDKIAALLRGFESSEDEGESQHEGFTEGQVIPGLPKERKTRKKLKGIDQTENDTPGVVYVGRIPHGFYEREMRSYFTQFGGILRLRLSRNKKTGRSKHYAFVEFASSEVARIVAETMDNYLMFGHILKCKIVPQDQVHENLWKGANRRFKKIPHSRIEGRKLEVAVSKEKWVSRVQTETKRRKEKAGKLKAIGYEFDAPALKKVKDIKRKEEAKLITGGSVTGVARGETNSQEKEAPDAAIMHEEAISKNIKAAIKAKELDAQSPRTAITNGEAAGKKKKETQKKANVSKTEDLGRTGDTPKKDGGSTKKLKKAKTAHKRVIK
ncbi:hypothetical protein FGG08_001854 [Glutinoglossum americanum]|uniref:RRM domain-containing protein n=1 Tax=Glutinoglossum americanum TaxID=1670608 RepID=A0A9P8L288_9PEZI|nr:hypothetical protein FGG08_001854 [Glutinoglossum americanum]